LGLVEASLWLGIRRFKTSWLKVRLIMLTLFAITVNFTVLLVLTGGLQLPPIALSLTLLMLIAFSATILHVIDWSTSDIGLLKALGGRKGTITLAFLIELALIGLTSALSGLGVGLLILGLLVEASALTSVLPQLLTVILASVVAGSLAGTLFVWRELGRTVTEIMSHGEH
jgi:hypothetical protein